MNGRRRVSRGGKFRKKILVKYSFIASEWKIQTAFIFELNNNDVHDPIILIIPMPSRSPILLLFTLLLS